MSQPYTTLAEAQAPPVALRRLMARAAYESTRPPSSSRPRFEETTAEWQAAMDVEMTAAITAALNAGYRITPP